jgi:hypothetical protein
MVMPIHESDLYEAAGQLADVSYIWSGTGNQDETRREEDDQAIRDLPPETRKSVFEAVEDGLTDEIDSLITSLEAEYSRAASRMHVLARNFDYEYLLELLGPADDS